MRRDRDGKRFLLLLLAVIVLGIYVLPSAIAKFAGSHTWEFNATTRVTALQCGKCHTYIKNEINNTNAQMYAGDAISAHLAASNNTNYVSNASGAPIYIPSLPASWDATYDNVCWMCHTVESGFTASTHTKVTIRACTDIDCHGNYLNYTDNGVSAPAAPTGTNITNCQIWNENICNVTGRINSTSDAHKNFYYPLTAYESPYGNEGGYQYGSESTANGKYTYGFVACLACHTHVGLSLNFTRPNELEAEFNLTDMTGTTTSAPWNITNLYVNMSSTNFSYGGKDPGSVWY